jgi:omega-hydroxy-beta-dihydromenaquinone-9 sulfotransferase
MNEKPTTTHQGWTPRIWFGCDLSAWLRILWKGRYSFGWKELRLLPISTFINCGHTFLRYAQEGLYGRRIRESRIEQPPIFILGHWRSGTTLLHEMLVRDPRHTFPTTYQCFDPCHSLLTDRIVQSYFRWMLPAKRIMDNIPVGWERPQEDEFALALLGQPSPYSSIAFPNRRPLDPESLDLDGLPEKTRENWKRTFLHFLKTITLRDPRRLVLKSPPHTCRIPTLLEMFPDAKFIHIVRDPVAVYSSTINLWKALYLYQGLHTPTFAGLEDEVFETFLHFHRRLDDTRGLIPQNNLYELRFEDLTKDPVEEMRHLYEDLDLGDFENLCPHLERYLADNARYERNKWTPSAEEVAEITRRWGDVMRKYGYLPEEGFTRLYSPPATRSAA